MISWWRRSGSYRFLSKALLDDPKYIKALQRRAASNEQINSWSSLTSAQEGLQFSLTPIPF